MRAITLEYDDLSGRLNPVEERTDSIAGLKMRLVELAEKYSPRVGMPFGVDLTASDGDHLSVAFAPDAAVITHYSAVNDEYQTAVGNTGATGEGLYYFGDRTLMSNRFRVPKNLAWRVIEEWCETGQRSHDVHWTSDII